MSINEDGDSRMLWVIALTLWVLAIACFFAAGSISTYKRTHSPLILNPDYHWLVYLKGPENERVSEAAIITTDVVPFPEQGIPRLEGQQVYLILQLGKKAAVGRKLGGVPPSFKTEPDQDSTWYLYVFPDFPSAIACVEADGFRSASAEADASGEPTEAAPSGEPSDGRILLAPGAKGEMTILLSTDTGQPTAAAIASKGLRPSGGVRLPELKSGETYLLIQSAEATVPPIGDRGPVLEESYGQTGAGGINRIYVVPEAVAELVTNNLIDYLPALKGKVRQESRPMAGLPLN